MAYPLHSTEGGVPASPSLPEVERRVLDYWANDKTFVASVDPAPGPERLLVTVVAPPQATTEAIEAAFAALAELKPALRAEVARAIHRKRVPDLAFRVAVEAATVPPPVVGGDGNAGDGNGDDVDED